MQNNQPPEKQVHTSGYYLDVQGVFHTLQGEGPFAGCPAVFIRLAGCNLQCPGCDTDYTSARGIIPLPQILLAVKQAHGNAPTKLVVITGGEPFRQQLLPLVQFLLNYKYRVQIETNGTLYQDLPYGAITVVCSPKTGSINRLLVPHLSALKYVVDADNVADDGYPIRALHHGTGVLARPPRNFPGKIYMQPFDCGDTADNLRHQKAAIQSCFTTGARYCHQLHKLIGLE